jgi:hypothetical protein
MRPLRVKRGASSGITDLQLYVLRFHPPTEMLGRYLRQHIAPDGPAEPTGGASVIPDLRSRMEAAEGLVLTRQLALSANVPVGTFVGAI